MNTKKLISVILTITLLVSMTMSFSVAHAEGKVKIELFGEIITLPQGYGNPFIDTTTNRTLVPARGLFEAVGATVNWAPETRTVSVSKEGLEVKVTIDSTLAYKNTTAIVLDQPPVIVDDRTYVPLRFIAESLDLNVDFDGTTTTVIIKEAVKKVKTPGEGIYKVGEEIDAEEYLFIANKDASAGNVKVKLLRDKDSSKAENVINSFDIKTSLYISLIGCNYVELVGCTAYPLDSLPQRVTNNSCENGMFKVGKDLEAGMYAVSRVDSKQTASYKTYYFPFSKDEANETINEAKISANRNILLRKGQYILLENSKLSLIQVSSSEVSGGGSSGSGSGSGSGSKPVVVPSATAKPSPVPTATPTVAPGATSTVSPTEEPTVAPLPTETPVSTHPPVAEPTTDPNVSTELFYPEFDGTIYDFGYCFQVPLHLKEEIIEDVIVDYMYEITSSELIDNDTVNLEYLRSAYGANFLNEGFEETNVPGNILGEYRLYNPEKSIEIICFFSKRVFDIDLYYVNVTILRNTLS
ncbi:MAG: hypothetical protein IKB60_03125 [Clostridia bacterium]|nr:hypothetical protein [Clostridia bacterium]